MKIEFNDEELNLFKGKLKEYIAEKKGAAAYWGARIDGFNTPYVKYNIQICLEDSRILNELLNKLDHEGEHEDDSTEYDVFRLTSEKSEMIRRALVSKIHSNLSMIKGFNKTAETYIEHEISINELHADVVIMENIMSYMRFIKKGSIGKWLVISPADMRVECARERAKEDRQISGSLNGVLDDMKIQRIELERLKIEALREEAAEKKKQEMERIRAAIDESLTPRCTRCKKTLDYQKDEYGCSGCRALNDAAIDQKSDKACFDSYFYRGKHVYATKHKIGDILPKGIGHFILSAKQGDMFGNVMIVKAYEDENPKPWVWVVNMKDFRKNYRKFRG